MKQIYTFVILALFLSSNLYSQAIEELEKKIAAQNGISSKTRIDYKYTSGKVTSQGIKSSITSYNRDGNILKIESFNPKGMLTGTEKYAYDSKGNRTLFERGGTSKYKKQTQYNGQNKILLEAGFNGSENFRNEYTYSTNGKLSEILYKVGTRIQQKLVYDHSSNTTLVSVYTKGVTLTSKIKMVYDAKGNLLAESTLSTSGKELEKKVYKYTTNSKLSEETKTRDGSFYYTITYAYNPAGDLTKVAEETLAKKKYTKKEYVYDGKGNLIHYKWRRNPDVDFNMKTYTYNSKGICLTEHTFYPKTKFELLTKFEYQFH